MCSLNSWPLGLDLDPGLICQAIITGRVFFDGELLLNEQITMHFCTVNSCTFPPDEKYTNAQGRFTFSFLADQYPADVYPYVVLTVRGRQIILPNTVGFPLDHNYYF